MKTKFILRVIGSMFLILSLFIISSCSKSSDENATKVEKEENPEAAVIDEKDFSESDEDLSTVDYKEFYDQLSPHGEWIQVRSAEIGLKPNTAQLQFESSEDNSLSLSSLFGVKDANAFTDVNESMVFVWKPSIDLGVSVKTEDVPVFTPYTNGQWINTDAGWYFKAPTPAEETVSHYGRWVNTSSAGWLWVPGRVWAPAWVDWKQDENYISWAPLPPSVYLVDNVINEPVINVKDYVIVERKYFLEPAVYKYNTLYNNDGNTILVKDMEGTDGIVVINNTINNIGPDVKTIQTIYDKNIELIKLNHVKKHKEVIYSNGEYFVYSPGFMKYKNKKNKRVKVNMPESYKEYDDMYVNNSDVKESKNEGDKAKKENDYDINNNPMNKGNNGNMNNDHMNNGNNGKKNNDHMNNGNNGNMNSGNDKGNKNNDKDNSSKNKSKDKGSKNNGKNNGKGKN